MVVIRVSVALALALAGTVALASGARAAVPATCPGPDDPAFGPITTVAGAFDAGLEGAFVQIPFDVPDGTTGIRVRYCHDQPDTALPRGLNANTLDLGVYEPAGAGSEVHGPREVRGWSGGAIGDVTIAVNGFSDEATYEADSKGYVSGRTTRAYEPGPIPAGEWVAELGLASIATVAELNLDNAVAWRVDVQTTTSPAFADEPYEPVPYDPAPAREGPGWYAGDFHAHGEHEPGNALMRETFDYAFRPFATGGAGLDFLTLVDHNNVVAFGEIGRHQPDHPGNLIARGAEITTYRGHFQAQATSRAVDYRTGPILRRAADGTLTQVRAARPVSELFDEVQDAGGYTQINHPTSFPSVAPPLAAFCRGCPWDYGAAETDYRKVDAIEVATGPAGLEAGPADPGPNPFTPLALRFYEEALGANGVNRSRIAAVGSSDSHHAGDPNEPITQTPIGTGQTIVFAPELSEAGIAEGIAEQHSYVKVWGSDGPDLRLEATAPGLAETAIMGDTVAASQATLTARILGLERARAARAGAYSLVVVRDGAPLLTLPIPTGDQFEFSFPNLGAPSRYSLWVMRGTAGASLEAASSPIWVDPAGDPEESPPTEPPDPEPPDPEADCSEAPALRLTVGADRFDGTPLADRVAGRAGADTLLGRRGDDCLRGGRGRDGVGGGPGDDELGGGRQADRVWGGPGTDRIRGGRGSDRLLSADGEADQVRCGKGRRDRAVVDRRDRTRGCERIRVR